MAKEKERRGSQGEEQPEENIHLKIIDEKRLSPNEEPEIRNRFRGSPEDAEETNLNSGWASIYVNENRENEGEETRWIEKDPETNKTFKRTQQKVGIFSVMWGGGEGPDLISREQAWKLYLARLQEESNYLLATPDKTEICCCQECIMEYELQCNEVLGWRKRAPTVEGFSEEVNKLCDPSAPDIIADIIQEKYRSLPCAIM